jgi:membrane-bound ClpP family serine protease
MQKYTRRFILILSFTLFIAGIVGIAFSADKPKKDKTAPPPAAAVQPKRVYLIKIDAPITPVVAEYIIKSIDQDRQSRGDHRIEHARGLVDAMQIVIRMMA